MFARRCFYHWFLGIVLSLGWLWLAWGQWDSGVILTTDFWMGLMLLLLFQSCRLANYVQKSLGEKPKLGEQFKIWERLALPYFAESFSYLMAAFALAYRGGPETLTYRAAELRPALEVLIPGVLCIGLLPLCASVLGWKLSASRVPAFLPVVAAAQLTMAITTASFELHISWLRDGFPMLPVLGVTVSALGFLLVGCNTPADWLTTRKAPRPSILVACLMPAVFPLFLIVQHIAFAIFVALLTLLACGPVYLVAWLLPWRPQQFFGRMVGCFVFSAMASYSLAITGAMLVVMEEAWMSPILDEFHLFVIVGLICTTAVCCEREV